MASTNQSTQSQANQLITASLTGLELLDAPLTPPVRILGEVFPAGELGLLHGQPGTGKTLLALDLALCIGAGVPWYGLSTTSTPVAFLNLELGEYFLQERLAWLAIVAGCGLSGAGQLFGL